MKSSEILNKISSPKELLKYMENNITYGFVGNNNKVYIDQESNDWNDWYDVCIVQNGNQVLESNVGICWDQVELERLWFSKHNYNFVTIFIWFSVDYKNNYPTHSFLLFEEKINKYKTYVIKKMTEMLYFSHNFHITYVIFEWEHQYYPHSFP